MAEVVGFSDNFAGLNGCSEIVVKITSVKYDQNLDVKCDINHISKADLVVLKTNDYHEQQLWMAKKCYENKGVSWTFKNVANGGYMYPDTCFDPTNPKSLKVRTNPNIPFKWRVQHSVILACPPIQEKHYIISPFEVCESLKGNIELLKDTLLKAAGRDLPVEVSPIPIGYCGGVPPEFKWDITIV